MLNYTTTPNGHSSSDGNSLLAEPRVSQIEDRAMRSSGDDHLISVVSKLDPKSLKALWALLWFQQKGRLLRPFELQATTDFTEYYARSSVKRLFESKLALPEDIPLDQREGNAKVRYRLANGINIELLEQLLMEALSPEEQELRNIDPDSIKSFREKELANKKEPIKQSLDDLLLKIRPPHRAIYRRMAEFLASHGPITAKMAAHALGLHDETARDQLNKLESVKIATRMRRKGSRESIFSLLPDISITQESTSIEEVSEKMSHTTAQNSVSSDTQVDECALEMDLLSERLLKVYPPLNTVWTDDLKKEWFVTLREIFRFEAQRTV